MRLTFISHEFPPIGGGASSALDAITKKLAERGQVVQILTIGLGNKNQCETDKFGRIIIRFGVGRGKILAPSAWELLLSYKALRFKSLSHLREFAPNVLTAFFAFPAGHAALFWGSCLNIPVVVSFRGSDVPGFSDGRWGLFRYARFFLLRPVWKRADLLLANGRRLSHLAERFMPTRKVVNLPNGVDIKIYHPSSQCNGQGPLKVLFVGQLIERKRCIEMLDGMEWLAKQGIPFELTIVGEGPLLPRIELFAKYLQRNQRKIRIILMGHIQRDKMPEIYRQHNVLVLLSKAEGVSNVLLEALASGLCIIASKAASNDVLKDKEAGIVIDTVTPSAIGRALLTLAKSLDFRIEMQNAARKLSKSFDWNVTVASFEDHISRLLDKNDQS